MILSKQPPIRFCLSFNEFLDAFADQVNHLADTHEDAEDRGNHHEEGENLLLCWAGDVAVHCVGAGLQGALGQARHVVAFVDMVEDIEETSVKTSLENQTQL